MTDFEIDSMLAERAERYASSMSLPDGFGERLAESVRRSRRRPAARLAIAALAAAALAACLAGFVSSGDDGEKRECAMAAAKPSGDGAAQVTNLLALGFVRECMRRQRSARDEDEEAAEERPPEGK